jgi:hypothetical protein
MNTIKIKDILKKIEEDDKRLIEYYKLEELKTNLEKELLCYKQEQLLLNTNEDYKSNNETFQPRVETQTELPRQWINCRPCQGRGEIICNDCNGTTLSFCGSCSGRGTFNGKICYLCNGALKLKCTKCYGKGNLGRCTSCGGRGQVQR